MEANLPDNCRNCGAKLDVKAGVIKCDYCGTIVTDATDDTEPIQPKPTPEAVNTPVNTSGTQGEKGCGPAVLISIVLFMIFVGWLIAQNNKGTTATNYADSLSVDTTTKVNNVKKDTVEETGQQRANKTTLKELNDVQVNLAMFKKLYRAARKHTDKFSGKMFIHDQTSPAYVNRNGVFLYISAEPKEDYYPLSYATQYYAEDWLFIENMVFNADGENSTFRPDFKRDNGDGMIWEWSDESVEDSEIATWVKIAKAKKAQVKYNGDKYYKVVTITPRQQAAIKRQLQILKGLLLGYNK